MPLTNASCPAALSTWPSGTSLMAWMEPRSSSLGYSIYRYMRSKSEGRGRGLHTCLGSSKGPARDTVWSISPLARPALRPVHTSHNLNAHFILVHTMHIPPSSTNRWH